MAHPRDFEALRQSEREAEAIRKTEPVRSPNPYQPLRDGHKQADSRLPTARTDEEKSEITDARRNAEIRLMHEQGRNKEDIAKKQRDHDSASQDDKARRHDYETERRGALEAGEAYVKSQGKSLTRDQQRELDTYREIDRQVEQERKNDGRDR